MLDDRRRSLTHTFDDTISLENLLLAWKEFVRGKRNKPDVLAFQHRLLGNLTELHRELSDGTYRHGGYHAFKIADPKPRDIHKALVRDRLLHHALYRVLYPFFDRAFIADSYSCRNDKGTHRAMSRFQAFARKVSQNDTRTCWVLKCDIRKFFASIDHAILFRILERSIHDERMLAVLREVVGSFQTPGLPGVGLPLGNLTSQLLVNVYMNEFDQYVKRRLREKHYIRYADDFVVLSESSKHLEKLLPKVRSFLDERLALTLHPDKVHIRTLASGVDFLGWVHFPDHRVLRAASRRRMMRNLAVERSDARVISYKGMLLHGNTWKVRKKAKLD